MKPIHKRLLETLARHPLMSPEQLGVVLAAWPNHVRDELKLLCTEGLVERINPRSPNIGPRALFYPTRRGMRVLEAETGMACALSFSRLAHLWLVIERVYRVRNIILTMTRWPVRDWDVEVEACFPVRGKSSTVQLHGAGIATIGGGAIPFVIEYDQGVLPLEVKRMAQWVAWQLAPPFIGRANEARFPVFLIISTDANRLSGYYTLLRAAAVARGLPLPHTYFTTTSAIARFAVNAPIWYSSATGDKTTQFAKVRTATADLQDLEAIGISHPARQTSATRVSLKLPRLDPLHRIGLVHCVGLKGRMSPQEKRVLNEIAAQPMLAPSEIAVLLQEALWRVKAAVGELQTLQLIDVHRREEEVRYALSSEGMEYLAACAGFGRAAKRYARARGWKYGTRSMIRHWEHTRAENRFFLQFAQAARSHGGHLTWRSELECRLYYEARGRRRSFLPDGDGVYRDQSGSIHFALEIERGRTSLRKLSAKLSQYYAFMDSRLYRQMTDGEFRLLMVTTSWQRAAKLYRIASELAQAWSLNPLSLWITTFDSLEAEGPRVGAAIWRGMERGERCHCIDSWNDSGNPKAQSQSLLDR